MNATTGPAPQNGTAGWGRRILALAVDWAVASAISAGFFAFDPMATLGVFAAMTVLLVGTAGSTIGHRLLGLAVRTDTGGLPGPLRALVRTLLVCLVIPAVVTDPEGRGAHDRAAGTRIQRR
ncbi:RDD family protein [Ruania halotolerans]|uniref:RDD family protein n=1 Tax=Ruania halotolerans TaxID=2897773 RepID=UPI001E3AC599|nr:RDD family protein [Ruania halotolerans]UFU04855.1 RDD family protein [Ruania halotolerans]